jgi:ribonuclease HII
MLIVGVDEVGLGAWAGPLVVCAFAARSDSWRLEGLDDSKKIDKKTRRTLAKTLAEVHSDDYVLVQVDANEIDLVGIAAALPAAMDVALKKLIDLIGIPERVIIDGDPPRRMLDTETALLGAEYYPKADGNFPCVMAASVLAKVYRDDLMAAHAITYPEYGFERHVGYGTPRHAAALDEHGVCALHRRSYAPIRERTTNRKIDK